MKLKLLVLSLFLKFVCFSQSENFMLTDTSDFLYMRHFILLNDSSEQFFTTVGSRFSPSESSDQIPVQYVDSAKKFYSYTFVRGIVPGTVRDSLISIIDLKKVKSFTIDIVSYFFQLDHFKKKPFDISHLEILDHLDLPSLNSIEIKVNPISLYFPIQINLPKWPIYRTLVENDSLFSLKINPWGIYSTDRNLTQDIQAFRHLKELYLLENINVELLAFPSLEKVYFADPVYLFSNSLVQLDRLADFNFNVTHSNVNYASFTFFLNNIKDTYLNHPVFYLDSLLKNYLPEKLKEGEVYILGSEIMDADVRYRANQVFGIYKSNDTIVRGNITNGKMTGVWQYNFFNDIIGSRINFYYDREKKGIASFPENGIWEYHYPNGNVAIEGNFLHGKKEGIWKFYDLSGKLASIKEYKKDEPHGLFIDYKLFENDFERRRYYLNKFEYKTILYNSRSPKQADIFTIYSNDVYQKQYYISGNDNNLECSKNGDIFKTIPNNSKKFRRLVYRHYVKYLYPERKK